MGELEEDTTITSIDGRKLILGRYELGRLLGKGTFAKVYHGRDLRTAETVAIKVLSKDQVLREPSMADQIQREISVMRLVRHPNVVDLKEVLATRSRIFFVLELARSGELFARVSRGRLPEHEARRYFSQLISAVDFCHSRGVSHRDLKPENLLLDHDGNLKVSDFGLSALPEQLRHDGLLHTQCGTPAYVAPEVLRRRGYDEHKKSSAGDDSGAGEGEERVSSPRFYNAFELIASMSGGWDLSGLFEKKKRKGGTVFTSRRPAAEILERLEKVGRGLGFRVVKGKGGCEVRMEGREEGRRGRLAVVAEVFEAAPEVAVVEFCKISGDTLEFSKFCEDDVRPGLKDIVWTWQGGDDHSNVTSGDCIFARA
ncbi:hypothetical protein J5N97_026998 [Dioscorea zingiberensis]|uniref:non-specific serine/threonine protein kinase n=1 Tax=Dioscorea zingiberensis TaxID=325984 RepID=A0A9D5C3Y4_9LILI|nr:hypothetical protein J5N97_026998 [Dioscorea zingiberensis]